MALTFEELVPGDFQPTSVDGGLPKLVRIWEYLRDLNTGGYGGAVLVDVKDAISNGHNGVTSCSPFSGTCIYMALDPRPFNAAQPWSLKEPYEPIFDGGKPLDVNFYRLHNGSVSPATPASRTRSLPAGRRISRSATSSASRSSPTTSPPSSSSTTRPDR